MLEETLNRPCGGRYANVLEAVGNTPLVELPRISPKPGVRIFAKLEGRNPTGSVKDRVAKAMIDAAEAEGAIEPGQTILEPTSGNTGISLAMICRRKGYPLKVVMPDNVTEERTQLLRMYGAEIVYSEGAKGSNGAVELALEMAEAGRLLLHALPVRQRGQPARPLRRHRAGDPRGARPRRRLRRRARHRRDADGRRPARSRSTIPRPRSSPPSRCRASWSRGCARSTTASSRRSSTSRVLDRKIMVSNRDAIVWTQKLLHEEGLFAGVSTGAIAAIAVRIAGELDEGNVVFIAPDDGWKYLSSGVYTKPVEELEGIDSTVWW